MKRSILIAICIGLSSISYLRAQGMVPPLPGLVGAFSDPARLTFEGVTTFSAEEIRRALMKNPDFLLASHPAARFGDYLPAVRTLVRMGYYHSGFPEAQVSVAVDGNSETIGVKVSEGPRCVCGEIEVVGAKTLPTDMFISQLIERRQRTAHASSAKQLRASKTDDPIWQTGKPAPFDKPSLDQLSSRIRSVLSELGYYFSQFTVAVVPEPDTSSARLLVQIETEGSRSIGEIVVSGHKKNAREDILQYLDLAEGMQFDHDLLSKINQQLWDSARFLDYSVTPEADVDRTAIRLKIFVREYEPAPALSEAFSPEEHLLLRFGDWLTEFCHREDDLMVSIPLKDINVRLQAVISPTQGLLLAARHHDDGQAVDPFNAVILAQKKITVFSPTRQAKFVLPASESHIIVRLSVLPNPDPNEEKLFTITPGVGVNNNQPGDPYSLEIKLAPVFFLYCLHKDNIDVTHLLDQGIVTFGSDNEFLVKIDTQSGRLIEMIHAGRDGGRIVLTVDRGLFDESMAHLEQSTSEHANRLVPQRPVGSTVRYLSECPLLHLGLYQQYGDRLGCSEEALGVAIPLLGRVLEDTTAPFDEWGLERRGVGEDHFVVPIRQTTQAASPMGRIVSSIAAQVFGGCHELFPPGSWPVTLARETVFVLGGMAKYTDMELRRIYQSPQTGPIGYLATARLLTHVNKPLSRIFAVKGLERLSFSDFQKDLSLVTEEDYLLFRCFDRLARALRDLDESDIDVLLDLVPQEAEGVVRDGIRRLREDDMTPVHKILIASLEPYWLDELKGNVALALRKLAYPAEAAGAGRTEATAPE
ncbi:MAG: hypothetical protein K9N55_13075 [Phycisphaerae bacterium]|nr:hypothetical protein [Phycisphaerae bacterium]